MEEGEKQKNSLIKNILLVKDIKLTLGIFLIFISIVIFVFSILKHFHPVSFIFPFFGLLFGFSLIFLRLLENINNKLLKAILTFIVFFLFFLSLGIFKSIFSILIK